MIVDTAQPFSMDLTGPDSHTVRIEPGQGSFALGEVGMAMGKPDAIVPPDVPIRWTAFDTYTTPAGDPWPRHLYYRGNDTAFAAWSRSRPIERFDWAPMASNQLDAAEARIATLAIHLAHGPLDIALAGGEVHELLISGQLDLLRPTAAAPATVPALTFTPGRQAHTAAYRLPPFPTLATATRLSMVLDELGPPLDCTSLLQFRDLRRLALRGNVTGLEALAELTQLESLSLRFCPDLQGMPDLRTWPLLTNFIGWNIEAGAGKVLRKQLAGLTAGGREMRHASVTQLRQPAWFVTEYALPFAAWPRKTAQAATKLYKAAAASIGTATSLEEVKAAVTAFVLAVNDLPNIETSEREDVAMGLVRLAGLAPMPVTAEQTLEWFDAVRDF